MSGGKLLTEEEDYNLYRAKKMLQLLADLGNAVIKDRRGVTVDHEALSIFAGVVLELLPKDR